MNLNIGKYYMPQVYKTCRAAKGEPDSLRQVITTLQIDSTITPTEKQSLVNYYSIVANVLDSSKTVYDADTLQLGNIPTIELANTKASVHANSILKARNKHKIHYFIADVVPTTSIARRFTFIEDTDDETISNANNGNFKLYPNPNMGNFSLELTNLQDNVTPVKIVITNILGEAIYEEIQDVNNRFEINATSLKMGIYSVTLYQENKNIGFSKLIIQ